MELNTIDSGIWTFEWGKELLLFPCVFLKPGDYTSLMIKHINE